MKNSNYRWDQYFWRVATAVASKSPCFSRQIGAILVRDKSIVATGYNGPPRGFPHCGIERYSTDGNLQKVLVSAAGVETNCPRSLLGFSSGHGLELCYAAHAERNCLINAARLGVSTLGCTLFMNACVPCKNCIIELINAGIKEVVVETTELYDEESELLIVHSDLLIREFSLPPTSASSSRPT